MNRCKLRLLQIEDSPDDAELIVAELRSGGFEIHCACVESLEAMELALDSATWDLVISDFNLPSFSPEGALQLLRRKELDIPFIVVSGCIGEHTAVAMMKAGAHDYLMKDHLARLVPAVERELREALSRRERRVALERLETNEKLLRDITSTLGEGIITMSRDGTLMFMNPEAEKLLGWQEHELMGVDVHDAIHCLKPDGSSLPKEDCPIQIMMESGSFYRSDDDVFVRKGGTPFPVSYIATPIMENGEMVAFVTAFQDITERKQAEHALKESRRQLRELSAFLQTVREEERTRIARELHDELGQVLTALRIDLGWLQPRVAGNDPRVADKLDAMSRLVDSTVDSVRRISGDLRPGMLDDLGLAAAIEWLVEQFRARNNIDCDLDMNREEFELNDQLATSVFRIVQEALTNVARHAQASLAHVRVEDNGSGIALEVADNGRGFTPVATGEKKTYGLLGIRERVKMLGGKMEIIGRPGQGAIVRAFIPFHYEGGGQ
ncbi:MAG: PAS domain S-box protein [Sulfuricella sp.]|nr:PAS domain S-box protein [Sulfuricella sp.]